jgi:hypothetical protein
VDLTGFVLRADAESRIIEGWKIELGFMDETGTDNNGHVILVCYIVRN